MRSRSHKLHRAGELTPVWVPDAVHEAVRDLVRAREAAADDLRRKRQQLLSFLLRRGRIYSGGGHWTLAHRRWLARQAFLRLNKSSSRKALTRSKMRLSVAPPPRSSASKALPIATS